LPIRLSRSGGVLTQLGANTVIYGLISGAAGGLIGFLFAENIYNPDRMMATTAAGLEAKSGVWVLIFGAILGALLMGWDGITSSSPQKALRDGAIGAGIGAVSGFLGGCVAQWLYLKLLHHALTTATSADSLKGDLIVARVVGWAVFGLLLGAGIGLKGGRRKVVNGLVGGTVGAAVGGLIFQLIDNSSTTTDGFWLRLIGLTATGVGVGLAVGLVERARRDSWVRIVAGPMAGKEFILYKHHTTLGRDYHCDIVLAKDAGAAPMHATFVREESGNVSVVPGPGAMIAVNGRPSGGGRVHSGDMVSVGSSTLSYTERAVSAGSAPPPVHR
jgi:hypothetical protein